MIFPVLGLLVSRYWATKTLAEADCWRLAKGPNIPKVLKTMPYSPYPSLPRRRAKKMAEAIRKTWAEMAPALFQKAPFRNLFLMGVGSTARQYLWRKAGLLESRYSNRRFSRR